MISAFASVLAVGAAAFTAVLVAVLTGRHRSLGMSSAPQRVPVLGGHAPNTHAWSRYHVRYYPMTLVFIAFEMEMMFMYPWAVVFVTEGVKALAEMGMFLTILGIGIVYTVRERALSWQ